ncbi:NAD(P)-dependent oxidoreductase [Bordetella sp. 2513F-2]
MSKPLQLTVGFIGLGDMGKPMAMRLLKAGIDMVVCDRNVAATQDFIAEGAKAVQSARDVADLADLVFTCLPSPAISETVALGDDGLLHGTRMRWYAESSTSGPETVARIADGLAAAGVQTLDAPVSGGPRAEAAGRLTCFVAASPEAFAAARPVLSVMSDRLFHVGHEPGQSQVLKLANNLLNAACLTISSEMVLMAQAAGIDLNVALEVINVSTGRNRATEDTLPTQVATGKFHTGARLDILHKDIQLALKEADRLEVSSTASQGVLTVWNQAMAAGLGATDLTRIYEFIAEKNRLASRAG